MTDAQSDTGMGPEVPAPTTRSTRRTRRLAIIGALAFVLIAGAVLAGVKSTGARAGAFTDGMTLVNSNMSCSRFYDKGSPSYPSVSFSWTPVDGSLTVANGGSQDARFTIYDGTLVRTATSSSIDQSGYADSDEYVNNISPYTAKLTKKMWVASINGRTMTITWGGLSGGKDTKYSQIWCPKLQ